MSYDEAKARAFKLLIPAVGTVFSCPATDHHGGHYWAVWEVHGHRHGAAFDALRAVPLVNQTVLTWHLSDYWLDLNTGRAKIFGKA